MSLTSAYAVLPCKRLWRTVFASANDTGQLRTKLDQLHSEAEKTRAKANNARLRLMRLSEAAEKLRLQAAISVQNGKENEARDLLFQKKMVMKALENSKSRIELLDELSTKLNEVISVKEMELIGNVASDFEFAREYSSSPVRIVSPKEETMIPRSNDEELQVLAEDEAKVSNNNELDDFERFLNMGIWNEDELASSLKGIFSYEDFLKHLDQQLNKIEEELGIVLRLSTLVLESEEKKKNAKLLQTTEIFESICAIRERIAKILREKQRTDSDP